MAPTDLRLRAYNSTRRWLRRLRVELWLDVYACQILSAPTASREAPSAWGRDELWMGEMGPGSEAWLTEAQPGRADAMKQRWRLGYRCFAASTTAAASRRSCSAYLWAAIGPVRFYSQSLGSALDIPAGVAWLFDAWAHPLSLGTYPDLNRFTVARLRAEGIGWTWGQVEYGNRVSLRLARRWGGEAVGAALSFRIAGLPVCFMSRRYMEPALEARVSPQTTG